MAMKLQRLARCVVTRDTRKLPTDPPPGAAAWAQLRRVSLPQGIGDSVAEAIATGRLASGDRLVEVKLAEQLGVSRVPVREALKVLHAQGILVGGSHRGYRVADFGPETAATVLETRLTIETLLLRDAISAWRAGVGDPAVLDLSIRDMALAAKMQDSLVSLRADIAFHSAIRDAARNAIAGTLWDALARHVLIIFNRPPYRDLNLDAVVRQHRAFRDDVARHVRAAGPAPKPAVLRRMLEDHLLQVARRPPAAPVRRVQKAVAAL